MGVVKMKKELNKMIEELDEKILQIRIDRTKNVSAHQEKMTELQFNCIIADLANARLNLENSLAYLLQYERDMEWVNETEASTSSS